MYVARRAFRNYNQMVLPGSVVEPGTTKWFKTRLKERLIVEVTPHNFDTWQSYFLDKYGVSLVEPAKVEPAKVEPAKAEPAKVEPAKVEPAKATPVRVTPVKATPTKG